MDKAYRPVSQLSANQSKSFAGGHNPSIIIFSVTFLKSYRLYATVIVNLFTFYIQSAMFSNRLGPPAETLTLFCA